MIKIGLCIVTCNRLNELEQTIQSLESSFSLLSERVIVDNGKDFNKYNIQKLAIKYGFFYIDGEESNSPHGQNLGLNYLKERCTHILKSDDDIIYKEDYVPLLEDVIAHHPVACAVSGSCWSQCRTEYISFVEGRWQKLSGEIITNEFRMFRSNDDGIFEVSSLHGGWIYNTCDALAIEQLTKKIRGGFHGEYFSKIAYGEETESTHVMQTLLKKKCLYVPKATCYHMYAEGGVRVVDNPNQNALKDQQGVQEVYKKLGISGGLFTEVGYCKRMGQL